MKQILTKNTEYQNQIQQKIKDLSQVSLDLENFKNQDQVKRNNTLEAEITNINNTYRQVISTYENMTDLRKSVKDMSDIDTVFATILQHLALRRYDEATSSLQLLTEKIEIEQRKLIPPTPTSAPIIPNNSPPGSGYSYQYVSTDKGIFAIAVIAGNLADTKVIVDTASDTDCSNNCPVISVGSMAQRNGAYAGISGSFFCPAEYPTCAGKTNSFDLLVMNKNKHYFNSDNNIYSTNPAVIFSNGSIRFVTAASQCGRDTGVDGVLSNFPLLVNNNSIAFTGDGTAKFNSKGPRGFVANKSTIVYIGYVYNATTAEAAVVLKAFGMENALALDNGGSTALWYSGGYKIGPGRNIANSILFVRK